MIIRLKCKNDILKSELFWLIMLSAFFEPAYFSKIYYLDLVFDVLKIVGFIFTTILVVRRGRYPTLLICTLSYYLVIISITFFKAGDIKTIVLQAISSIGTVTTVYLMSIYIRDRFMHCIALVFELLVYGNCISVIVAPRGLYRFITVTGWWTDACWLLGIRNSMTLTYLLGFYIEWVNYYINKNEKIRFISYIAVSTYTIFQINFSSYILIGAGSAGGLVICWMFILLYFFIPKKIPLLNFFNAFILDVIVFVLLVFFRIQRVFASLIETFLHKTATLSGRVYLWERSIKVIGDSFIFGYGVEYGRQMAHRLKAAASVNTTQNGFLDILYNGGIVLFAVFLVVVFVCAYLLKKHSTNSEIDTFVGYVTFVFFLCCQSESMVGVRFFFYLQLLILSNAYLQELNLADVIDARVVAHDIGDKRSLYQRFGPASKSIK